jgi:hypothetical protein
LRRGTAFGGTIQRERRPWRVEILNADEVLEPVDPIYRATGVRGGDLYNWTLRRGWTPGSAQVIPIMHGMIRLLHSGQVRHVDGPVCTLELKRGGFGFSLETDMSFDLLFLKHKSAVAEVVKKFGAELNEAEVCGLNRRRAAF